MTTTFASFANRLINRATLALASAFLVCSGLLGAPAVASAATNVGGTINADTTWTAANSPYVVSGSVTVDSGKTLTVDAGTVVKFLGQYSGMTVNGTLVVSGTAVNKVYFTSNRDDIGGDTDGTSIAPAREDWNAVTFAAGSTGTVSGAVFRYGGLYYYGNPWNTWGSRACVVNDGGTVSLLGSAVSDCGDEATGGLLQNSGFTAVASSSFEGNHPFGAYISGGSASFDSVSFSGATQYGLYVGSGASAVAVIGSTFSSNSVGAAYVAAPVAFSHSGNAATGPLSGFVTDGIENPGESWTADGMPYVVSGTVTVESGRTLSVSQGAVVKFSGISSGIYVKGTLAVGGTSASPTYFTSINDDVGGDTNAAGYTPAREDWNAVTFASGSIGTVDGAVFRYGGYYYYYNSYYNSNTRGACVVNEGGAVSLSGSSLSDCGDEAVGGVYQSSGSISVATTSFSGNHPHGAYLAGGAATLAGSAFSGATQYGLYATPGAVSLSVTGSSFSSNAVGAAFVAAPVAFTHSGNSATGPLSGFVTNGIEEAGSVWTADGMPYVVSGSVTADSGRTLSIEPGTVVKFNGISSGITVAGALDVNGTSESQVYFTSINDDVGGDTNAAGYTPAREDWNAVTFAAGSTGSVAGAVFRYGGYYYYYNSYYNSNTRGACVVNEGGAVSLSGSSLSDCGDEAVGGVYQSAGSISIATTSFSGNHPHGAYLAGGAATLAGATFSGATQYGLYATPGAVSLSVTGSSFSSNSVGAAFVAAPVAFTHSGNSATGPLSGFVTNGTEEPDASWTADGMPYVVSGYVIVASVRELSVSQGTVVKFNGISSGMTVAGTLTVDGTAASPAYFTSINDDLGGDTNAAGYTPARQDWDAVTFASGSTGTVSGAVIRYGGYYYYYNSYYNSGTKGACLYNAGGTVSLSGSSVTDCGGSTGGVYQDAGYISVAATTFVGDVPNGAYLLAGTASVAGSSFSGATSYGIITAGAAATVTGTSIHGNANGLLLSSGSLAVHDSSLVNNSTYAVNNTNSALTVDATGNWWGSASGPSVEQAVVPNYNPNRASRYVNVSAQLSEDPLIPETYLDTAPAATVASATATFTFHSSKEGTFWCKLDSGSFQACTSPKTYFDLADGEHAFAVQAADLVGNADLTPATAAWSVDTVPPTLSVTWPGDAGHVVDADSAAISGTADAGATSVTLGGVPCALDGAAFACPAVSLAPGANALTVVAADAVGNEATETATVTRLPDTLLDAPVPSGSVNTTSASISFHSDLAGATFQCSLDGADWAACASPKAYEGLDQGIRFFAVRALDAANHADATPAEAEWEVDTVAPVLAPLQPEDVTVATVDVTGTVDDATATVSIGTNFCTMNGTDWECLGVPVAVGPNVLTVVATDPAGNEDRVDLTVNRTVPIQATLPVMYGVDQKTPVAPGGTLNDGWAWFKTNITVPTSQQVILQVRLTRTDLFTPQTTIVTSELATIPVNVATELSATGHLDDGDYTWSYRLMRPDQDDSSVAWVPVTGKDFSINFQKIIKVAVTFIEPTNSVASSKSVSPPCKLFSSGYSARNQKYYRDLAHCVSNYFAEQSYHRVALSFPSLETSYPERLPAWISVSDTVAALGGKRELAINRVRTLGQNTMWIGNNEDPDVVIVVHKGESFQNRNTTNGIENIVTMAIPKGVAGGPVVVSVSEDDPFGAWAHEMTHAVGMLTVGSEYKTRDQDLYSDPGYTPPHNIGLYDIMAEGEWGGPTNNMGSDPSGMSTATRLFLGWLDLKVVPFGSYGADYWTRAIERAGYGSNALRYNLAGGNTEGYYLIEARDKSLGAWDSSLSEDGMRMVLYRRMLDGALKIPLYNRERDKLKKVNNKDGILAMGEAFDDPDYKVRFHAITTVPDTDGVPMINVGIEDIHQGSYDAKMLGVVKKSTPLAIPSAPSLASWSSSNGSRESSQVEASAVGGVGYGSSIPYTPFFGWYADNWRLLYKLTWIISVIGVLSWLPWLYLVWKHREIALRRRYLKIAKMLSVAAVASIILYIGLTTYAECCSVREQDPYTGPWPPPAAFGTGVADASTSAGTDLHLYCDDGRHIGLNYQTGEFEDDIPESLISGPMDGAAEWIFVPATVTGCRYAVSSFRNQQFLNDNPALAALMEVKTESYELYSRDFDPATGIFTSATVAGSITPGQDVIHDLTGSGADIGVSAGVAAPRTDVALSGDAAAAAGWYLGPVTVAMSSEPGAATSYSLDGGANWQAYTAPFTVSTPGITPLRYRSVGADDAQELTKSLDVKIDAEAPTTTATAAGIPGAYGWYTADLQVTLVATDAGAAGVALTEYSLDAGDTWTTYEAPFTLRGHDLRSFAYRSTDAAGNVEATESALALAGDAVPSAAAITAMPPSELSSYSATFEMSATAEGVDHLVCRLDDGPRVACASPATFSVTDGRHRLQVAAVDASGSLIGSVPAEYLWTVHVQPVSVFGPPDTFLDLVPAPVTAARTVRFAFHSDRPSSTFQCQLDGGEWEACASPKSYAVLAGWHHRFQVRAVSPGGLADTTPAVRDWTENDTMGIHLDVAPTDGSPAGDVTFAFHSDDPEAQIYCMVDVVSRPCSPSSFTTSVGPGYHALLLSACGQWGCGSLDYSWTAAYAPPEGETPPDTFLDAVPTDFTADYQTFTFHADGVMVSYECRLDADAWAPCIMGMYSVGPLDDGSHVFSVRAVTPGGTPDPTPAEFSWTQANAAAHALIDAAPSGTVRDPASSFAFHATKTGAAFECSLDSGDWTSCESPSTFTVAVDPVMPVPHQLAVRVATAAGGSEDAMPSYAAWTIDSSWESDAPTVSLLAAPPATSASTVAAFSFLSSTADRHYRCSLDGGSWAPCPTDASFAAENGDHTLSVRATNASGRGDASVTTYDWTVATEAGDGTSRALIDAVPPTPKTRPGVTFAFHAEGEGATTECRLDSGAWEACTSPRSFEVDDGDHVFQVRAVTAEGPSQADPAFFAWTEDDNALGVYILESLQNGPVYSGERVSVNFATENAAATLQCRVDMLDWFDCTSPYVPGSDSVGSHMIEVRAVSPSGRTGDAPSTWWFVNSPSWDQQAISGQITAVPATLSGSAMSTFAFRGDWDGIAFSCNLDMGGWQDCASPVTYSVDPGPHYLKVRVRDTGAFSFPWAEQDYGWTVATVAAEPGGALDTFIDSAPVANYYNVSAFAFHSTDASATFECSLNDAPWQSCVSPVQYDLVVGPQEFRVRAVADGVADATPAEYGWRNLGWYAMVPPGFTAVPPLDTTAGTANFQFGSDVECRLDGGTWVPCGSAASFAVASGSHAMDIRYSFAPGAVKSYYWTVSPNAAIDGGPDGEVSTRTASFSFHVLAENAAAECRLDGGEWAACESPYMAGGLPNGSHRFEVRQSGLGFDAPAAVRDWTVAVGPPDTVIDSSPDVATKSVSASFSFHSTDDSATFECRLDGGDWAACSSPAEYGVEIGAHSFGVRAISWDLAVDQSPAAFSWSVLEGLAPLTEATLAGRGGVGNQFSSDVTVTLSANDGEGGSGVATTEYSVDGGQTWLAYASPLVIGGPGTHEVLFRSTDAAGNVEEARSIAFSIDVEAPVTTSAATGILGTDGWYTADYAVTLSAADDVAVGRTEYSTDAGSTWAEYAGPFTLRGYDVRNFAYRSVDAAGNVEAAKTSFALFGDAAATSAVIDEAPPDMASSYAATFMFHTTSEGAGTVCRLDDGPRVACPSPSVFSVTDGRHRLQVSAVAPDGTLDAVPAEFMWTVAVQPAGGPADAPATYLDLVPTRVTDADSVQFAFHSDRPSSAFQCRLDGGAWVACASPFAAAVPEGWRHAFAVRAVAPNGSTDATPAEAVWSETDTFEITLDGAPTDGAAPGMPATFAFHAEEPGAAFTCTVDGVSVGSSVEPCTSPFTTPDLNAGQHVVHISGTGAWTSGSLTHVWNVAYDDPEDNVVPPETVVDSTWADTYNQGRYFQFHADGTHGLFECRMDGGAWSSCNGYYNVVGVIDGSHTFQVRALTPGGTPDSTPAEYTWTQENDTAQIAIDTQPYGGVYLDTPEATVAFHATKPDATFECNLDYSSWSPCTSPLNLTVAGGWHSLEIRLAAPYAGARHEWVGWGYDDGQFSNYGATIESAPPTATDSHDAVFVIHSQDDQDSFMCNLDGGGWSACPAVASFEVADGYHSIGIRTVYSYEHNEWWNSVSYWWTVTTPEGTAMMPRAYLDAAPPSFMSEGAASFYFHVEGEGATPECRLDGGAWFACSSPYAYDGADGQRLFEIRAAVAGEYVQPDPVSYSWVQDVRPMNVYFVAPYPVEIIFSGGSVAVSFVADNQNATTLCRQDGGEWAECTSPYRDASGAVGSHTLEVKTVSPYGRQGDVASTSWYVMPADVMVQSDSVILISVPATLSGSTSATFAFEDGIGVVGAAFRCNLDFGGWQDCATPASYAVAAGPHYFEVRSRDSSGTFPASDERSYAWIVATAAGNSEYLDTFIDSAPIANVFGAAAYAFHASQPGSSFECSLDYAPWMPCVSPVRYEVPRSAVTFRVRAVAGGAADATPAEATTDFASVPSWQPRLILAMPEIASDETVATFHLNAPYSSANECRLDGGDWTACTSWLSPEVGVGDHHLEVRTLGSTTPDVYYWTVVPSATIDSAPATLASLYGTSFSFRPFHDGAATECRLDGGAWTACTSPVAYESLGWPGTHVFEVRDVSADWLPTVAASYGWTAVSPPTLTVTSSPDATTPATAAGFSFASDVEWNAFECQFDGAAWSPCDSPATVAGLTEGPHSFAIRAAGYTGAEVSVATFEWTVTAPPPVVTIDFGPPATTTSTDASFSFHADEEGTELTCQLDYGQPEQCLASYAAYGLAPGVHVLSISSVYHGVPGEQVTYSWAAGAVETHLDGTPQAGNNPTTFAFHSDGSITDHLCRIDGGDWYPCASPATHYDGSAPGEHSFEVKIADYYGVPSIPVVYEWTVEEPTPVIDYGPGQYSNWSEAWMTFSTSTPWSSFRCRLDGGEWTPCSSPAVYHDLAAGEHSFTVAAYSFDGVQIGTPANYDWTVMTLAITDAPEKYSAASAASFSYQTDRLDATFQCQLDYSSWTPCSSTVAYSGLTEGPHSFAVRPVFQGIPSESAMAAHWWSVGYSSLAPQFSGETSYGSFHEDGTRRWDRVMMFSTDMPGASLECRFDSSSWAPCSSPVTLEDVAPGGHTFGVRAIWPDATIGSSSFYEWNDSTPQSFWMRHDMTDSVTKATSAAFDTSWNSGTVCRIDSGEWQTCGYSASYSDLSVGHHVFEMGYVSSSLIMTYEWDVVSEEGSGNGGNGGATAPDTFIDLAPATLALETATLAFHSDDASATFECQLDSGEWGTCTSEATYTALADGAHAFAVRAVNSVGTDLTPASVAWTVDATAPDAVIDFGPAATTASTGAEFTFHSFDESATFECRLDAGDWAACTSAKVYTDLAVGAHAFYLRATDFVGNVTAAAVEYLWEVIGE